MIKKCHGFSFFLVPWWMVFAVGLLGFLVAAICCYCLCFRKCCKKKKKEEKKAVKEKVDLKGVQMLTASYQEKVQPSADELDYNSDEFQSDGSSGVKIGMKQFLHSLPALVNLFIRLTQDITLLKMSCT